MNSQRHFLFYPTKIQMKKVFIVIISFFLFISLSHSQNIGIGLELEASVYQWHKKPNTITGGSSSAQLLAFPAIGPKIWFGDWEEYTISLEGKVDFAPFSFNIDEYYGMGAISFPVILKGNFSPFDPPAHNNGFTKIGIGIGTQWSKVDIYARPDFLNSIPNPFFITYIGELSCQLVIGNGRNSDQGISFEIFSRAGWGKQGARTFGLGLKVNYRYNAY